MYASMFRPFALAASVAVAVAWSSAPAHAQLVSYGGFFNQQAIISTRTKSFVGQDIVTPIGTINMRSVMAQAWNTHRAAHQENIRKYMVSKLGLHDVSVTLAAANVVPGPTDVAMVMYVDPSKKTLTLVHRISRHTMSGRLAVPWNFDPSIAGTYDLDMTVFLTSTGGPGAPMAYQGSRITVANFKHGVLDLAITGAANGFQSAVFTDAGTGPLTTSNLNSVLAPALAATQMVSVTPGMRFANSTFNLVFELTRPQPGLDVRR